MERSCGDRTVMMNGKKVRYIDPLSDWGFKRLFGTEVNKDFLRAFLQNLFPDKEISDITYMKPENQGLTRSDRQAGLQERIFIKLFEAAEIAAFSPEERKQYEHDMMTENDYRNTIEFAKDKAREEGMRRGLDEGMQKGLAEGMQKGLNEGMQKGLMTAAAGMKKMGMETDAIARATGLSREAVEQL